jgi:hypothetical protein
VQPSYSIRPKFALEEIAFTICKSEIFPPKPTGIKVTMHWICAKGVPHLEFRRWDCLWEIDPIRSRTIWSAYHELES